MLSDKLFLQTDGQASQLGPGDVALLASLDDITQRALQHFLCHLTTTIADGDVYLGNQREEEKGRKREGEGGGGM